MSEMLNFAGVVIPPLIAIIAWVIKVGMAKNNETISALTKSIEGLVRSQELERLRTHNDMSIIREKLTKLVEQHEDRSKLCTLSEVDTDLVRRAAKSTLREAHGSP